MTTLAQVNSTLLEVSDNTKETSRGISAFVKYLEKQKVRELEAQREKESNKAATVAKASSATKSQSGGSGGGFLSNLISNPLGALGTGLALGSAGLSKAVGRLVVPAIMVAASKAAGEYIESETGSKELGDATRRGMVGGGIGLIFGKRFGIIGGLIGAAFTEENKKKLEELGESLKPAGEALKAQVEKLTGELPTADEVLKKFQTTLGNALTGITNIAKGDFTNINDYLGDIAISAGAIFTALAPKSAFNIAMKTLRASFAGLKSAFSSGLSAIGMSSKLGSEASKTLKDGSKVKIQKGALKGQTATYDAKAGQFRGAEGKFLKRADVGISNKAEMDALKKFPRMAKFLKLGKVLGPLGSALGIAQLAMILADDGPISSKVDDIAGVFGGIGGGILGAIAGTAVGALATGPLAPIAAPAGGLLGAIGGSLAGDALAQGMAQFLLGQKVTAFPWWTGLNKMLSGDTQSVNESMTTQEKSQKSYSNSRGAKRNQRSSITTTPNVSVSTKNNNYNQKLKTSMMAIDDFAGSKSGTTVIGGDSTITNNNTNNSVSNTSVVARSGVYDAQDQFGFMPT